MQELVVVDADEDVAMVAINAFQPRLFPKGEANHPRW